LKYPIRIFSDLHLGHPSCRISEVQELEPLLQGAGSVVFNGDTFEERSRALLERSTVHFENLQQLCRDAGVEVSFLTGNHDPEFSDCHYLDLCEGRVFVSHGDILYPDISPWSRESEELRELGIEKAIPLDQNLEERCQQMQWARRQLSPLPLHKNYRRLGRLASLVEELYPPQRPIEIIKVWMRSHQRAASFLDQYRPEAQAMIFGHTHFPKMNQYRGRRYFNTGSFCHFSQPRMVEVHEEYLRYVSLRRTTQKERASWVEGRSRVFYLSA